MFVVKSTIRGVAVAVVAVPVVEATVIVWGIVVLLPLLLLLLLSVTSCTCTGAPGSLLLLSLLMLMLLLSASSARNGLLDITSGVGDTGDLCRATAVLLVGVCQVLMQMLSIGIPPSSAGQLGYP